MNSGRGPNPEGSRPDDRIPDASPVPDEVVDALLDGDLQGDARREAFEALRGEPEACERLASTRAMLHALRETAEPAPDLSGAILRQVNARRRFLTPKWRRMVRGGRLAVAAGVLMGIGLVAVAQRVWPEATTLAVQPAPIASLVGSTAADADAGVRTLAAAPTRLATAIGGGLAARTTPAAEAHGSRVLSDATLDHVVVYDYAREPALSGTQLRVIDLAAATEFFSSTAGSQWPAAACDVALTRVARRGEPAPGSAPSPALAAGPSHHGWTTSVAGFGGFGLFQSNGSGSNGAQASHGSAYSPRLRPGHAARFTVIAQPAPGGVTVLVTSWRAPAPGDAQPSVAARAVDVLP